MSSSLSIQIRRDIRCDKVPQDILHSSRPVILKGFVEQWPVVEQAKSGDRSVVDYLLSLYNEQHVTVLECEESMKGRFFYNEDYSGFNFTRAKASLKQVFERIVSQSCPEALYVGSTTVSRVFPQFEQHNPIDLAGKNPLVSVWMGNHSRIAAHYDLPENIACVTAGTRRFTLFPPEQIDNLYPGPLDITPAGQQVSLVDFHYPDFEKFPDFQIALENAQVALLEAGDALFIPSMWWHHVESLGSFNMLVNYWWRNTPQFMGNPMNALNLAMMEIRDLPPHQKALWQAFFNYFVFSEQGEKFDHIPKHILGKLDTLDDATSRKLRAQLLSRLNR